MNLLSDGGAFLGARKSGRSPSGEEPDLLPRSTALGNCIIT